MRARENSARTLDNGKHCHRARQHELRNAFLRCIGGFNAGVSRACRGIGSGLSRLSATEHTRGQDDNTEALGDSATSTHPTNVSMATPSRNHGFPTLSAHLGSDPTVTAHRLRSAL